MLVLFLQKAKWNLGDETGDGTYELCDVLYDASAKCNQKLASDSGYEVCCQII
jgi:hypothetical protein